MKSDVPDFGIELAKVPYFLYYRLCRMEVLFWFLTSAVGEAGDILLQ